MKLRLMPFSILSALFLSSCFSPAQSASSASIHTESSIPISSSVTSILTSSEETIPGRFSFSSSSEIVLEKGVSILTARNPNGDTMRIKALYDAGKKCFEKACNRVFYNLDPIEGIESIEFYLDEDIYGSLTVIALTSSNPLDETVFEGGYADIEMTQFYVGSNGLEGEITTIEGAAECGYFCLFVEDTYEDAGKNLLESFDVTSALTEVAPPDGIPFDGEESEEIQKVCRNLYTGTEVPFFNGYGLYAVNGGTSDTFIGFKRYYYDFSWNRISNVLLNLGFREIATGREDRKQWYFENGYGWSKFQTILAEWRGGKTANISSVEFWLQWNSDIRTMDGWSAQTIRELYGDTWSRVLPEPRIEFNNTNFTICNQVNGEFYIDAAYRKGEEDARVDVDYYASQLIEQGFYRDINDINGLTSAVLYHPGYGYKVTIAVNGRQFEIVCGIYDVLDEFPIDLLKQTFDPFVSADLIPSPSAKLGSSFTTSGSYFAETTYKEDELYPDKDLIIHIFDVNRDAYHAYREAFESNASLQGDSWVPAFITFSDVSEGGVAIIQLKAGIDENLAFARDFEAGIVSSFNDFTTIRDGVADRIGQLATSAFPDLAAIPENTCDTMADWKTVTGLDIKGITLARFCEGLGAVYQSEAGYYLGRIAGNSGLIHNYIITGHDTISGCHILFGDAPTE